MLRRSRHIPALAVAACGLLAAACSAPASVRPSAIPSTLTAGPAPQYTAVAFPRPAAGWLLGRPGFGVARAEIWHSVTAGRTWQPQWQGAGDPLALSATDPAHARALIACPGSALEPNTTSCRRTLIATTDAGLHWRPIARLPAAVNQVRFSGRLGVATSDRCLAVPSTTRCPGQLLVSRDGGAHWTPVLAAPGPVFATAVAAGQMWAAEPAGSVISFLTSTDSGRHWRALGRVTSPWPLSPDVRLDLAAGPPDPPGSPGLAWVSVFDQLSCAMHGCSTALLLHSEDGGQSWHQVTLADSRPDQCGPGNIAFSAAPDGSTWAATGRNGAACSPPLGLLYRSGPHGASQRSLPALPPWQLTQVTSLDAVSGEVAYAIGGQDLLARTGDGGLHWTELAHLPGVVTQLDFPAPADGVAATYQAGAPAGTPPWELWRSRDGGLTWQAAGPLPGGNTDILGPWFSGSGHGLLLTVAAGIPWESGSGGTPPIRVWTTADWGSSWSRGALLPLGRDSLTGLASFTPAGGLVPGVGWSGWLVIDTAAFAQHVAVANGGPLRLLPAPLNANNVQLLGHGTGFAWGLEDRGGSGHSILALSRTTDDGHSWRHSSTTLVAPPGAGYTPLLDFSDASHGWLVYGGVTWRTSDGGINWT